MVLAVLPNYLGLSVLAMRSAALPFSCYAAFHDHLLLFVQVVLDSLVTGLFAASRGALHLIVVSRTSTLAFPQAAVCQLQPLPEDDAK